ncbi:MAG: hypothetical protein JWO52_4565 [Gammaproteobacteria bacterium]|nr:hypothetical protein [Gammaproteobacteria bacterium]
MIFAQYLRDLRVEANATERGVRGESGHRKTDGIYWAMQRGESARVRQQAQSVARELARGGLVSARTLIEGVARPV